MRDGNLPAYKFVGYTNRVTVYDGNGININQIDLSEADETFVADSGEVLFAEEHHISVINSPIYSTNIRDGMDNTSGNLYTNKVYIWGKYLIMTPHMAFSKTVDSEIFDTRLIGTETEAGDVKKLPQLPTKFIVNTLDTEIYLHPSYCPFGFNEFEVEQSNNCTCKIYDVKGYLIFDGTDKGDGTYILKVYKDEKDKPGIYFGALEYSYFGCLWQVTEVNRDLQSRERLDNLEYNFITTESAYEHNELSESSKDLIIEAEPTWGGDVFINYGTDLIPRESFNRTFPWGGVTITHEDYTFKLTGVVTSKTTVNLTKADDRSNIYHELPEGSVGKVLNLMMFTEDASNIAINFDIYDADKNNILHAVPGALIDRIYTSKKYTIPEGAVYYSIGFYFVNTDVELDTDIKLYLLIDNEYERLTLSNGKAMRKNILATSLSTLPYKSYLRYKGGIKELALIDNIPTKTSELENDSGYVTSNDLRNLPEVTEADNGKVLMVVNGTWQVVNTEGLTAITKNEEEIPLSETY